MRGGNIFPPRCNHLRTLRVMALKTSFAFTQIHTMKPINCILLCLGLSSLLACASKSVAPGIQLDMKETECGAGKVLKKISRETGIVRYDAGERKYAVVVTVPNTYDSQNVGFVCNLPASLQKEGVSIMFDGEYRPHGKKPMLGGLKYYYLKLTWVAAKPQ